MTLLKIIVVRGNVPSTIDIIKRDFYGSFTNRERELEVMYASHN
jgi:hypothetical protein